jgi:hypothetical protein
MNLTEFNPIFKNQPGGVMLLEGRRLISYSDSQLTIEHARSEHNISAFSKQNYQYFWLNQAVENH